MCQGNDGKEWQQNTLRRELLRQASGLAVTARKLEENQDYPNKSPQSLARLVRVTAELLAKTLEDTPDGRLKHVATLLCCDEFLRIVEHSRVSLTPWSMIQATEVFLRKYVGDDAYFIISPEWNYNYGVRTGVFAAFEKALSGLEWFPLDEWRKEVGWGEKLFCISFPRIEKLNVLLHANLGHELGHIITQRKVEVSFEKMWLEKEAEIKERLKNLIRGDASFEAMGDLLKETVAEIKASDDTEKVRQVALQALIETTADKVGVRVFGPAALASMAEICTRWHVDINPIGNGNYPPWRYRLRILAQECSRDLDAISQNEQRIHADIVPFLEWLLKIREFTSSATDMKEIQSNPISAEAYKLVNQALDDMNELVTSSIPDEKKTFSLVENQEEISELIGRLEDQVPPNESGIWPDIKPASLETILNACWAYKLKEISQDKSWCEKNIERLFRLCLKAIESSYVSTTFGPKLIEAYLQD